MQARSRSSLIRSSHQNVWASSDTWSMGHLRRTHIKFDSDLHFYTLTKSFKGQMNVKSSLVSFPNFTFFSLSPKYAYTLQFCLRIPNCHLFRCTTITNAKRCTFQKSIATCFFFCNFGGRGEYDHCTVKIRTHLFILHARCLLIAL